MNKIKYILYITGVLASYDGHSQPTKPNIIVINCDDMGYGDLSCFGSPTIKTPNIDRMAIEGQKWSSFYVSASVSSPSRAGLLTGRLGVRTGMYGDQRRVLFPDSKGGLPSEELTIAELLKQAGYHTACIGKWHLGHLPEYMPLRHGFDYFYGYPYSNDMSRKEQIKLGNTKYPYEYIIYEQEKELEREPQQYNLTQQVTEAAIRYIKSNENSPFFLYLYCLTCIIIRTVTVRSRGVAMFAPTDRLFSIGQFARLHEVNKKTLMWYDEIALLKPAVTKPN